MPNTGWMGTETVLDYWSSEAGLVARQIWDLALLLGLLGTSAGLWPQRLDFHSKIELSHTVMDETSGIVYLGTVLCFCSNKSCPYTSNPAMYVSLQCISWTLQRNPISSVNSISSMFWSCNNNKVNYYSENLLNYAIYLAIFFLPIIRNSNRMAAGCH